MIYLEVEIVASGNYQDSRPVVDSQTPGCDEHSVEEAPRNKKSVSGPKIPTSVDVVAFPYGTQVFFIRL